MSGKKKKTGTTPGMPDVSVVIPTFLGRHRIARALDSLAAQTLPSSAYEIITVVNGEDDGTADMLRRMRALSYGASLRVVTTPIASAAAARNLGIAAARGRYITFVDDDDHVSPQFLEALFKHADPDVVTIAPLADVTERGPGIPDFDTYVNRATFKHAGRTVAFDQLSDAASANAAKLVSSTIAKRHRYPETLTSGEDVAFWAEVFASEALKIRVLPPASGAVYYRSLRPGSTSRAMSARFGHDRVENISLLRTLAQAHPGAARSLNRLVRGQARLLASYMREHPDNRLPLLDSIAARSISNFPYSAVNAALTDRIVVSYAFPPYSDTSGMVVARRVCVAREPVDVLTHAMDNIREKDDISHRMVRESVGAVLTVGGPAVFANWRRIAIFVSAGIAKIGRQEERRGRAYREMYSRSMWPAAHVLAAVFKVRNPGVKWIAEFSDPMSIDSGGARRESIIPDGDPLFNEVEKYLRRRKLPTTKSRNLWEWIETIVYALADEVVFTNENQMKFMLDHSAAPQLRARVEARARIERHPTLPPAFYTLEKSSYALPTNRTNFGYFGVFYPVRGVGDILIALRDLSPEERAKVMLHIFTNKPDETLEQVAKMDLQDCVSVQAYLPYLEFLELTRHFDWLIVSDARVAEVHGINPYLPSKYSDYVGSGARIWALVEPGSVLSTIETDARTELGDFAAARRVLVGEVPRSAPSAPRS